MQIHVAKNGQQTGPFDEAQVRERLANGEFAPTDLAWHADLAGWQPLSTLFPATPETPADAAPAAPPSPVAAVPVFPGGFPSSAPPAAPTSLPPAYAPSPYTPPPAAPYPALGGGGYAPLPVSGMPGQLPPPQFYNAGLVADPNLASLGARFLAFVIDVCLVLPAYLPAIVLGSFRPQEDGSMTATGVVGILLSMLIALVLAGFQIYLLSTSGQTIGKRIAKVRIVMLDGRPAGFVQAFLMRTLVGALPGVLCGVYPFVDYGFIFRADRRCIHDLIAGTKVVRAE